MNIAEQVIAGLIVLVISFFIFDLCIKPYFMSNKHGEAEKCKYTIHLPNGIGNITVRNRALNKNETNLMNDKSLSKAQILHKETYVCAIPNGTEVTVRGHYKHYYLIDFKLENNKEFTGYIVENYSGENTVYYCDKPYLIMTLPEEYKKFENRELPR